MPDVSHVADVTCNAVVPPLSRQCLIHTRGREFRSSRGLEAVEPRATYSHMYTYVYDIAGRPTVRRLRSTPFHSMILYFDESHLSSGSAKTIPRFSVSPGALSVLRQLSRWKRFRGNQSRNGNRRLTVKITVIEPAALPYPRPFLNYLRSFARETEPVFFTQYPIPDFHSRSLLL